MNRRQFLRGIGALSAAGLAIPATGCASLIPRALATSPQQTLADFPVDGRILYIAGDDIRVWSQGASTRVSQGSRWEGPDWSPDGKLIAASIMGTNSSDICVLDTSGNVVRQLTNHVQGRKSIAAQSWGRKPVWSPDGTRIVYISDDVPASSNGFKPIDMSLFVVGADGKNVKRLITTPFFSGGADWPTWSPDGLQIAYDQFEMSKPSQISVFRLDTGERRPLTSYPDGAYAPAWSPDGKWIAYTLRSSGKHNIYALPVDGGDPVKLTDSGVNVAPAWSPDGSLLAYVAQSEDATADIWALKLSSAGGLSVEGSKQLTFGEPVKTTSGLSWTS